MVAATIPDLDGLGIIFGVKYYFQFHHIIFHNLLASILVPALLSLLGPRRLFCFILYFGLFNLHILLDSFGSGREWGISYLWPFSDHHFINPYAWDFQDWQNIAALLLMVGITLFQVKAKRRTPFELVAPRLDRWLLKKL